MKPKDLAEELDIPWEENMDHEEILAKHYRKQGKTKVHCCPEWDFMAIYEGSPEFEACLCDLDDLP